MIKNLLKLVIIWGLIIGGFFVVSSPIYAADCARPVSGNFTVTTDCVFGGLVDGVDTGTGSTNTAKLIVQSGILTINSNQVTVLGSISMTGGSIAANGSIKTGAPLWMIDADADGYPSTTTQYTQTSAPTNGRRRNVMTSLTVDCNDGSYSATNTCCTLLTWYRDSDSDNYGNPSVTTQACTQPAGYVSNNTDCYDSNANAKPGQTTCYTSHRGDGSYDYNCDGSSSGCNTCPANCVTGGYFMVKGCTTGTCRYCVNVGWKTQKLNSGSAGCGKGGSYAGNRKKTSCVSSNCNCTASGGKNISCYSCTKSCR